MSAPFHCTLSVTLKAPFVFGADVSRRWGVDVEQICNTKGVRIIPATHIRGVLRHAWRLVQVSGFSDKDIFGAEGDAVTEISGRISFTDLVCPDERPENLVTRVAVDDVNGAVAEGMFLVAETNGKPGTPATFSGKVTIWADDATQAKAITAHLEKALEAVDSIGRFKTAGFGEVTGSKVDDPVPASSTPGNHLSGTEFTLKFRLDRPLMANVRRLDSNTLVGADVISGGTLKGALARQLAKAGPVSAGMNAALSKMIFTQAVPWVGGGQAAGADSGWACDIGKWKNAADEAETGIWPKPNINFANFQDIPAFFSDWKDEPPAVLRRDVRTRVEIHPDTGAARETKLFSTSAIAPEADGHPLIWQSSVRWPGTATDPDFLACLNALQAGLFSIGKTNAETVEMAVSAGNAAPAITVASTYRVMLTSPCLMLRECHLADEKAYAKALNDYWQAATGGALEIAREDPAQLPSRDNPLDYYCQQELRGGHEAIKYAAFFNAQALEPFVLCKPGSVFRLKAENNQVASAKLEELRRTGLPVARWSGGSLTVEANVHHDLCPFIPQNGYGAFEVLA